MLLKEITQAIEQFKIAQNKFDNATGEEVEIAAYELKAAELRLNMLLRKAKNENIVIN